MDEREINVELRVDFDGIDASVDENPTYTVWNTYTARVVKSFGSLEEAVRFAEDTLDAAVAGGLWDNGYVLLSPICHALHHNLWQTETA